MQILFVKILCAFLGKCPALNLANGDVTYDKSLAGGLYPKTTKVSITCNSGYYGPSHATCYVEGNWGRHPPSCDRGTEIKRLLYFLGFC